MPYCKNDNCGVFVKDTLEWMKNDQLCDACIKDVLPDFDEISDFKIELKEGFEWYQISVNELYRIFKHKIKDELSCSNGELYNNYGD